MHFPNIFIREFFAFVSSFSPKNQHYTLNQEKLRFYNFLLFSSPFPGSSCAASTQQRVVQGTKSPTAGQDETTTLFVFCVRLDGERMKHKPPHFFPCLSHELWQFDLYPSLKTNKKR